MPEGPSLVILKERLQPFSGRIVTAVGGYSKMPKKWLVKKKLLEIKTWGKHLLLHFADGTVRIHLMLFGSVLINETKKVNASIWLKFGKDVVNFYVVNVSKIDEPLKEIYDWRTDIMHTAWDKKFVLKKMKEHPDENIGDLLMDQDVFTGVGNIIRNEVMFRVAIHPLTKVKNIPAAVASKLVSETRKYGKEFLKQRKADTLSKHWQAYHQKECPRDGATFKVNDIGKVKRKTYYCTNCQTLYS